MDKEIRSRWNSKREAIYNMYDRINHLKNRVKKDLDSENEKEQLTALIIRIMLYTSERVGNKTSAEQGHFGVTHFKRKHIILIPPSTVRLSYVGKSGVVHEKEFSDSFSYKILKDLKKRNNVYIFTTKDGQRISPEMVNRYLSRFEAKSKDIRGYNANKMMIDALKKQVARNGNKRFDEKDIPKVFNHCLRDVSEKVGHGSATLRTHYLLPEIESEFYKNGRLK